MMYRKQKYESLNARYDFRSRIGAFAFVVISLFISLACGTGSSTGNESQNSEGNFRSVPSERFSLENANKNLPEGFLDNISIELAYAGQGGDGRLCDNERQPTIVLSIETLVLPDRVHLASCGWASNELVKFTLKYPDGKVIVSESAYTKLDDEWSSKTDYSVAFNYYLELHYPTGEYTYMFEGQDTILTGSFNAQKPRGPQVFTIKGSRIEQYMYVDPDRADFNLYLYNFSPNEKVHLLFYKYPTSGHTFSFYGGEIFKVSSQGELIVYVDGMSNMYSFAVVGDISGEVVNTLGRTVKGYASSSSQRSEPPENPETVNSSSCDTSVYKPFNDVWLRGGGVSRGCPRAEAFTRNGAYQKFEHGVMIWHAGASGDAGGMIYVIYDGGNWQEYADTFVNGQMEKAGHQPPSGLLEPVRGFGKIWRDKLNGPSAKIGWALSSEQAAQVTVQPFPRTGVIISCDYGTYFLPDGVKWNQ